jgi:uncharacterized protein (TIGR01777 family)
MNAQTYTRKTTINAPVEDVFSWHERDGAIQRLTPPWAPLELVSRTGEGVKKGVKVSFRIHLFKLPMIWNAEHVEYEKNVMFKDVQTKGPFSRWTHTHRFIRVSDNQTVMEDHVEFKLPLGFLSRPFYSMAINDIDRMFAYRHQVLKNDLEYLTGNPPQKRILISGASGTIGSSLVPFLKTCGHEVVQLIRKKEDLKPDQVFWDPYAGQIELGPDERFDAVINLNGVDISRGRWTDRQKQKIIDSRVIPTQFLAQVISTFKKRPDVFISSSAIGFYGDRQDKIISEKDQKGDCFISQVCDKWEQASLVAQDSGIRTIQLRIGVVLTPAGGALQRMAPAFQTGCGVRLSHGRQYMSWISMEDALAGILHMLEHDTISGPVNLTAPEPSTNAQFSKILATVFSRRVFFVMPGWMVSLLWGQMGRETLLASARVRPGKLLGTGFSFQHVNLAAALKTMLGR